MAERLRRFREKYWRWVATAIIAICWAAFIVGSQISEVSNAFIRSGAIQLVILTILLDLSLSSARGSAKNSLSVSGRDSEGSSGLADVVEHKQIANADMLEFSGVAVEGLIQALAAKGCRVRLLVKHPDTVSPFQTRRIVASLEALFGRDYSDRVSVKCYRFNASLRGRRLGTELINLGWYTPFIENGSLARYEVMGHDNALITASLGTQEGRSLERMFQGVFDALWSAADTEDARLVVDRYGVDPGRATPPPSAGNSRP